MMRKVGVIIFSLFIVVAAISLGLWPYDDQEGRIWALLIAGSPGFHNYGLQADVCHAYQLLRNGGVSEDHIVVAMADDIAHNPRNFMPGMIYNGWKCGSIYDSWKCGSDVYHGVPKDYTGKNLTLENVLAALTGKRKALRGGSGKVLKPKSNDRVFIFYSGHGISGLLQMGEEVLESKVLHDAIQQMYIKKSYKSMVIYVAACYSGSMFVHFNEKYKAMNVYIMTASNDKEPAFQTKKVNGITFGTIFGTQWMKYSERHDRKNKTLEEQYQHVRRVLGDTVDQSEVMQYGEKEIAKQTLHLYQGFV